MANQDVRVSALQSASTLSTDDLALATVVDELSETGYTSKKITEGAKASQYLEAFTFANLNTSAKTIVGAINEAATTGAGDFPIHINNSTITETAGEVLDAMAAGLKPYVIWTNNSQSNYTFTYSLTAVWNPDATTETLIFGCPVTGAVRTIHVFINPTTRTYSSSIQVVDYNIPQINDSSTSSSSVWSSQKTASELAGKAEIDDTAVSSSTAWSSSQIASLLPTDTASGAVASFNDGADAVPVKSLVANIDYKDTAGFSVVNVTRTGSNIWDEQWELGLINTNNGTNGPDTTRIRSKNYIPIKADVSYYIGSGGGATYLFFYDKNKNYLGYHGANKNNSSVTPKLLVNSKDPQVSFENACFMRFRHDTTTDNGVFINYPATDTTYHAYTGATSTINLDGTIYGGSVDITNGTVASTKAQDGTDLPDPVVTQISPTDLPTLYGVNNIWADTGDVSVEYRADVQKYIDKKIAEAVSNRSLSLMKSAAEETKQEEQEGDEDVNR